MSKITELQAELAEMEALLAADIPQDEKDFATEEIESLKKQIADLEANPEPPNPKKEKKPKATKAKAEKTGDKELAIQEEQEKNARLKKFLDIEKRIKEAVADGDVSAGNLYKEWSDKIGDIKAQKTLLVAHILGDEKPIEQACELLAKDIKAKYELSELSDKEKEELADLNSAILKKLKARSTPKPKVELSPLLRVLMPTHQQKFLKELDAEGIKELQPVIDSLEKDVATIEKSQEEVKDPIVKAHYFYGGSDWFVTELEDIADGILFGFGVLNGDYEMAELGRMNLDEFNDTGKVEMDFHWQPKPLSQAKHELSPKYFPLEGKRENTKEKEPEKQHKYKLGEGWRSDFDYDGMVEYCEKVTEDTPLQTLEKLQYSLDDVNYHDLGGSLWQYIKLFKDADGKQTSKTKKAWEEFKKALGEYNGEDETEETLGNTPKNHIAKPEPRIIVVAGKEYNLDDCDEALAAVDARREQKKDANGKYHKRPSATKAKANLEQAVTQIADAIPQTKIDKHPKQVISALKAFSTKMKAAFDELDEVLSQTDLTRLKSAFAEIEEVIKGIKEDDVEKKADGGKVVEKAQNKIVISNGDAVWQEGVMTKQGKLPGHWITTSENRHWATNFGTIENAIEKIKEWHTLGKYKRPFYIDEIDSSPIPKGRYYPSSIIRICTVHKDGNIEYWGGV